MAGKKIKFSGHVPWPKPSFTTVVKSNKQYRSNYHAAVLYAHYELSSIELKREVIKYLKTIDVKHPMLDRIKDLHENRFATIGKYMYILNQGGDLPDEVGSQLMTAFERIVHEEEVRLIEQEARFKESIIEEHKKPAQVVNIAPITIQDRIRDKAREVAGDIEGWIDDFSLDRKLPLKTVDDFVNLFKAADLKAPHMKFVLAEFEHRVSEITEAVGGKNKDLNEGYSHYSKVELKKVLMFYINLLKACAMMQEVAKVERAPRKKKLVSHDKIVSKLKFKKDDSTLGIVSLNPAHIIGSKEVWVYNTKTRKLAQYKANDDQGLTVKGTGLLNYTTDSVEKTVRKPVETLADFKKASKVKLRTFMKELSTVDIPCSGKLNEHHVILRIDK